MFQYRAHLFVVCALAAAVITGAHGFFQNSLKDLRFNWFARNATGEIVVVAIDPRSIDSVGIWPWSRTIHASLIEKLQAAGAKDIAFDIDFSSASNPAADQIFANALRDAGGSVILPAFAQLADSGADKGGLHINRPIAAFEKNAWLGIVNVRVERDGLVRNYAFGDQIDGTFFPSMAALLAGAYQQDANAITIDFTIRADSIPTVSYTDVIEGVPSVLKQIEGKKVIVGGTAIELGDRFSIPNGRIVPGVKLQALAVESILQGRALQNVSAVIPIAAIIALFGGMILIWRTTSAMSRVALLLGAAAACEAAAIALQVLYPFIVDFTLLHLTVAAYLIAIALDEIDIRDLLSNVADKKFRHIAMSLGDGLICADRAGHITLWNPGATAIFGYEEPEMLGQPLDALFKDAQRKRSPFSVLSLPKEQIQHSGGRILELFAIKKSGETFPVEACFSGWQGTDGFQFGVLIRDISARKREEDRIRYLAEHDPLTGLANRNTLDANLTESILMAASASEQLALLVIGLDGFQKINDMLGHEYGDQVLVAVSERLRVLAGGAKLIARLSGDEFAILITGPESSLTAEQLAARLSWSFRNTALPLKSRSQSIGTSIGGAVYPADGQTAEELLANSHLALCKAKSTSRGEYAFFEREIRDELEARFALEAELATAVRKGEFELHYQPQFNFAENRIVGAEALIRWRHPERGLLFPGSFMPVVNTSPISDDVATWVMTEACRQGKKWQDLGYRVRMAVNLSPSQFKTNGLARQVKQVIAESGFSPALLELEVTEDILLGNDDFVLDVFRQVQELGIRIAFDDFGTGYGSFSYLKKFPLNKLKIDKSFVFELCKNSDDAAIVASTISLCRQLNLSLTAEGIEDAETAKLLAAMGCEEGQGYYFGKAIPAADFEMTFLRPAAREAVEDRTLSVA